MPRILKNVKCTLQELDNGKKNKNKTTTTKKKPEKTKPEKRAK